MIPKNIFQTNRSQEYVDNNQILKRAQTTWKNQKGFRYYFFDDNQMKRFMLDHFDERVNEAFDLCPMMIMKADLWRYCVIYIHGGIYADSDTIRKKSMTEFVNHDVDLVIFGEDNKLNQQCFCQWIFAAPVNSPILKAIIDECVTRILNTHKFKGLNTVLNTTGPSMFTNIIENYLKNRGFVVYTDKEDYAWKLTPNKHVFVYPHEYADGILTSHLYSGQWDDGWVARVLRLPSITG
jgi:mannosyltransferase OCH1-like enzyme